MSNVITGNNPSKDNFIRRYLERLAGNRLSKRFKRLIYISSILGLIQQVKDPDMVLVNKLNDVFKIAKYPDSFIFPMYIKSLIWKDLSTGIELCSRSIKISDIPQASLTFVDCNVIGMHFATNAPQWLRYANDDTMVRDVTLLITKMMAFKAA